MTWDMVLAGVGGQGILLASRLIIEDAVRRGAPVRGAETHGMAQRGGSVVAHVRLGTCHSPLVLPGTARLVLALDPAEGLRNLSFLAEGALLLVSAEDEGFAPPEVRTWLAERRVRLRCVDGAGVAAECGNPRALNTAMLGFAAGHAEAPFDVDGLGAVLREVVAERHQAANLAALALGAERAREGPS